jgi:hypothetical protein
MAKSSFLNMFLSFASIADGSRERSFRNSGLALDGRAERPGGTQLCLRVPSTAFRANG